jgi:phage terminase small subunit
LEDGLAKKRINKLVEKNDGALTPQQELFCQEYVKDLNGKNAALRAGYAETSAQTQSSRLISNVKVQQRITELNNKKLKTVKVDAETILSELLKLATSDIRKLFNENGGLLPPSQWPDDIAPAVASIQVDELFDYDKGEKYQVGVTKKVKLWDKNAALDKLAKHLGLLIEKVELSGKVTLEDLVNGSFKK